MSNFLINEFQPSSAAAWKQKIQFELDGADYNQTLLTKTNEGITISPFYHLDSFEKLTVPLPKEDFRTCKTITVESEITANSLALSALEIGAKAILFEISKPFNSSLLFHNLLFKNIEFHFKFNFLDEDFINALVLKLSSETVYFNIDIIGNLVRTGNWYSSLKKDNCKLENLIKKNPKSFIISVDVATYQNSGANSVQQVAYALAHANEYLTVFGAEIANRIQFNFAIGSNYFFEIAKIRAFHYLYDLILEKYNTTAIAKVCAKPSLRNKTLYNTKINTLRVTTESMSAVLGGATTIVTNLTSVDFAEDQHAILNEISRFKGTQDIAINSYYIEYLTKQLAEKGLTIFKNIEESGGFLRQLKEGTIQRKITENAKKEQAQFDSNSIFYEAKKDFKEVLKKKPNLKTRRKTLIIPILPKRLSEKMEQKIMSNEA